MNYTTIPSKEKITHVIEKLKSNGINAHFVESKEDATKKVLELIPEGSEVMNMTSVTLDQLDIPKMINESGKYNSVRNKLSKLDRQTQSHEMQRLGSAPEWTIGSIQAVTEDGHLISISNTGSQLPAYAYGASNVVFVVSTKKIVRDFAEALKRTEEYVVPLETERAKKAYGLPETFHTNISKVLLITRETNPNRIHLIFVNEDLGY